MSANHFFMSNLDKDIKETFYNSIANYILNDDDVSLHNLPLKLRGAIKDTILDILSTSASSDGIRLPIGTIITSTNCPEKYRPFFDILLRFKSESYRNEEKIMLMISQILNLESFQELNPTQFILEAKGLAEPEPYHDEEGVTPDLIRDTFYNEMVNQTLIAINNNWLTVDDLESQESNVFFALPALTIVEAIQESQGCNGILLLNGKVLNQKNCPDDAQFQNLVRPILSVQAKISAFSKDQLHEVKQALASDSGLPGNLTTLQTPELRESFAAIKVTAIEITQRKVFHQMVTKVIETCLETMDSAPAPSL